MSDNPLDHLAEPLNPFVQRMMWFLSETEQQAAKLLGNLLRLHRYLVLATFVTMLLGAVFEVSSLAILVLALQTLFGEITATDLSETRLIGGLFTSVQDFSSEQLFFVLLLTAISMQILRSSFTLTRGVLGARLQVRCEGDTRQSMFSQFLKKPYEQISSFKIGDLSAYSDQCRCVGSVIYLLSQMFVFLTVAVALTGVLFWISPVMTITALGMIAIMARPLKKVFVSIQKSGLKQVDSEIAMSETTLEFLQAFPLIYTFSRHQYAISEYGKSLNDYLHAKQRSLSLQALVTPLVEILAVIGISGCLIGGWFLFAGDGKMAMGKLIGFLLVLYRLLPQANGFSNANGGLAGFVAQVARVSRMLSSAREQKQQKYDNTFSKLRSEVVFRNVSFRYPSSDQMVLQDVTFNIPKGKMVAIVGASGSGKSTLSALLLGLYRPSQGSILIDGEDLNCLETDQWRERLGVVSQDAFLFHTTLEENIRFGRLNASADEIFQAAETAGVDQFVQQMPDGYRTIVGDRGQRLSGGQRQRIAIARALIRSPDLLILDEATSSLDNETERIIQKSIGSLIGKCTILAIAHRLSTIAMADHIVVLENGRVVEQGTHEELLARKKYYFKYWTLQSSSGHQESHQPNQNTQISREAA